MPPNKENPKKKENAHVRARNKAKVEEAAKSQAKEDAKWQETDDKVAKQLQKKQQKDREEAEKAAQRAAAKAERDKQLREEEALIAKEKSKQKTKLNTPRHITRTEISANITKIDSEPAQAGPSTAVPSEEEPIPENLNRELDWSNLVDARNLDSAVEQLMLEDGTVVDRHPEKRRKQLYAEFEARELPVFREDNPGARLNQLKHMVFEKWLKSPENPANLKK